MSVPISSPAVSAGLGLFETMLVRNERVVQLAEHRDRMIASAAGLDLPVPTGDEFEEKAAQAARGIAGEAAVRIVWVAAEDERWLLHATRFEVPAATLSRRALGRAITLPASLRRALPRHKLTSYAVCNLALRDAVRHGADEALFVEAQGGVLEGTATNLFAIAGDLLLTPPLEAGILPGIVRSWVLNNAAAEGMRIEERTPSIEQIRAGAFFTGSLTTIAPVRAVDGKPCAGPQPIVDRLRRRYEEATMTVAS